MALQALYYSIHIQAAPEEVHRIMLDREHYRDWTQPFSPTSDVRGDWSEGAEIYFISRDKEGKERGMIAVIDKNIPGELTAIRHISIFGDGTEQYSGEQVDGWKHAYEIYRFKPADGGTLLTCSMEISEPEHGQMFYSLWPQALNRLKNICEQQADHGKE